MQLLDLEVLSRGWEQPTRRKCSLRTNKEKEFVEVSSNKRQKPITAFPREKSFLIQVYTYTPFFCRPLFLIKWRSRGP